MPVNRSLLGALLIAGSLVQPAAAHMVWLERGGDTVRFFFGEYAENLRERTGGHLDAIAAPQLVGSAASSSREADHIAFAPLTGGDTRATGQLAPWSDRARGGRTRSVYLAREGRTDTRAVLDLELVPVRSDGDAFTLLFRGEPLRRTKVVLIGPPGWSKELQTDAEGHVTLPTPWAGRYVAEVQHVDPTAGGQEAAAYDRTSYVSTLSFTAQDGIPWTAQR